MAEDSDIKHTLGIVVGKLDMLLETQRNNTVRLEHIEKRVSSLELHRGYILGAVASMGLFWVFVVEWVKTKFIGG